MNNQEENPDLSLLSSQTLEESDITATRERVDSTTLDQQDFNIPTLTLEAPPQESPQQQQQQHSQQFYFNYQQNVPSKNTSSSGASETRTVDVLVIGGGPASLGLLVNAVKTNRLNELIQGDGIAIVEAGLNFGGGILGKYGINSNTSGGGFLKCTYKKVKKVETTIVPAVQEQQVKGGDSLQPKKHNVASEKQTRRVAAVKPNKSEGNNGLTNPYAQQLAMSQKNFQEQPIIGPSIVPVVSNNSMQTEIFPPYRDLHISHIARTLKEFGKNTAPLAVIGHFLNYAGNHLLSFIHQTTKKKIFYPLHKVVSVQLMSNGEILTKVKRQQLEITVSDDSEQLRIIETEAIVMFRSKTLIIGNGGVQGLHPELFNWFPTLERDKVIASDEFLRSEGYKRHIKALNQKSQKKIVIIGGSHSGFSCAWMLLNGPAAYYKNNADINVPKEPYAQRKSVKNCIDCCQCGTVLQNLKRAKLHKEQQVNSMTSPNKHSQQITALSTCNCLCICFGLFDYDDWKFNYEGDLPDLQEASIEILYREQIKVFYNKVSDAERDGYDQFESEKFSKKDGYLYSFSGLRGDAKDLYLKVMRGQEKRVKLIQARDATDQSEYVNRADLVIWACGYQTNQIPIKDTDRKRVALSQLVPNTQYDVDGKCRIMLADKQVLAKCFACGIGYPVRTKDGMLVSNPTIKNPRADGFSLYMNYVGDNILKNIIPKAKMIRSTIHKIQPKVKQSVAISNNDNMMSGEAFTKNKYQQVLRTRIMQYRQKTTATSGNEEEEGALRNKSNGIMMRGSQQPIIVAQPSSNEETTQDTENIRGQSRSVNERGHKQQATVVLSDDGLIESYDKLEPLIEPNNRPTLKKEKDGAKSVDRGSQKQTFQNKFSQMARSPQILQRKQEKILKLQTKEEILHMNEDIANLQNDPVYSVVQNKVKPSKPQQNPTKSPYSNMKGAGNQMINRIQQSDNKQQPSVGKQQPSRELLRSSQGANRKLDHILALHSKNENIGASNGVFKATRSSQIALNKNKVQDALYNSVGSSTTSVAFDQQNMSKSSRQQNPKNNPPFELPPINQQNYQMIQQQNDNEKPNHRSSSIYNDLKSNKSGNSRANNKVTRTTEDEPRDIIKRPLSDHQREEIMGSGIEYPNDKMVSPKNKQKSHKKKSTRASKTNTNVTLLNELSTPDHSSKKAAIKMLDEDDHLLFNDRLHNNEDEQHQDNYHSGNFGGEEQIICPPSPSPYENDNFEDHDSVYNGTDDDVSSEGSCRTSIYQRSQTHSQKDSSDGVPAKQTTNPSTTVVEMTQHLETKQSIVPQNNSKIPRIAMKQSHEYAALKQQDQKIKSLAQRYKAGSNIVMGPSQSPAPNNRKTFKRTSMPGTKEQSETRQQPLLQQYYAQKTENFENGAVTLNNQNDGRLKSSQSNGSSHMQRRLQNQGKFTQVRQGARDNGIMGGVRRNNTGEKTANVK